MNKEDRISEIYDEIKEKYKDQISDWYMFESHKVACVDGYFYASELRAIADALDEYKRKLEEEGLIEE
jgi:hypothetical protein